MSLRSRLVAIPLALLGILAVPMSASATEAGRIVEVKRDGANLSLVFQADGLADGVSVEPKSVSVQVNGQTVEATAEPVTSGDSVKRVAVLAFDNSRSMAGAKLDSAKSAAATFLAGLPADVQVGLVTFSSTTVTVVQPTIDHAQVQSAVDGLQIDPKIGTALFDGAAAAADLTGDAGARNVLMLTDGNEYGNSTTTLAQAVGKATDDDVAVDAVYIGDTAAPTELSDLVTGAGGQVVLAATGSLDAAFQRFAAAISSQLFVTAKLPADVPGSGNVVVSAQAGSTTLSDSAFASFVEGADTPPTSTGPIPVQEAGSTLVPKSSLPIVLGAMFLGLVILLYVAMAAIKRDEKQGRVRRRLSVYTLTGRAPVKQEETTTALGSSQVARSAVEFAGRVVQKRDFETGLALRLEAAGVPLRAAEWMLIHIGVAIGAALLMLLLSGGNIIPTLLGLFIGLALPWAYLIIKEGRRTSAFLGQLPDTLQLLAGSLQAGYSMPQAMDTVVREGQQPITSEFNRALVESRLGVPIEDALDGIAERMKSKDFAWVVMAIKIQREVGGNLAELLTTVSGTLRERERLRRQVKVLSAEGRLSAWILGLLPIVFALYLALVRPNYIAPLVSELLGWLMLGFGTVLLIVGALWLRKAVKVEV